MGKPRTSKDVVCVASRKAFPEDSMSSVMLTESSAVSRFSESTDCISVVLRGKTLIRFGTGDFFTRLCCRWREVLLRSRAWS